MPPTDRRRTPRPTTTTGIFGDDAALADAVRSAAGVALACQTRPGDAIPDGRICVLFFASGTVAATWDPTLGDAMADTASPRLESE